jgi:hypothetical protein
LELIVKHWAMQLAVIVALIWAASMTAADAQTEATSAPAAPKTLLQALQGGAAAGGAETADDNRIDPDRPHFPEAATTVGLGRAVLESGYTFSQKAGEQLSHSYPEALIRVGVFADWFELRVGQNLSEQRTMGGLTRSSGGFQDLYLGAKIALTEQNGLIPTAALIPQMTVPTGSSDQTAHRVLAGLNTDFAWDIVKDRFGIELLIANNQIRDELGGIQYQLATGVTGVFQASKQLELFAEWDAYYVRGGLASTLPQHYAVGGLVYFITPNLEVDARAGVGLNHRSNDVLAGVGFAIRH